MGQRAARRRCAALEFFADVVRAGLADGERSELEMLDAHDLSRCRIQRDPEASS
jgi:hypothetical protein